MKADIDEFDYVVVGAGAAGCVLAHRLSADQSVTVCLLEAGPSDKSLLLQIPAGVYRASSSARYAWQFGTEPSEGTAYRSIPMPQGKTLGGSTSINGMNYNRGAPEDFDDWARQGNRGWSYAEVLPYFKKSEQRVGQSDPYYRGRSGPLSITDNDWLHPVCDAFIRSARRHGVPNNSDYNGATQAGAGYYQRYIHKGWRVSAAAAFLAPNRGKKNLDVRTSAQAISIAFDGRRAVGVQYVRGAGSSACTVRARREIILSAGAANTPKLLQLSGIGPADVLSSIGIPTVHDLRVGDNLQDHYMVHLVISLKGTTAISGRGLSLLREAVKWIRGRPSILSISPSLVYGFVNCTKSNSKPDTQIDVALGNYLRSANERLPVLKLGFYQLKPKSTGYVRAKSRIAFEPPIIQPNYLRSEQDCEAVIRGIATIRKLLEGPDLEPYYRSEELPGKLVQADDECLQFARESGLTAYHLCGTCKMGPRSDPAAVVDDQLRIHGLQNIRVADASVMPSVPSANTSAAVFMIAEKASDAILRRVPLLRSQPVLAC
jgi:choline dehydrogenase